MSTSPLLFGKVVVITGAASGIGASAARVLARHGAAVVLADINDEGGWKTAEAVSNAGGTSVFMHADVTSDHDVAALMQAAVDRFGRLDCAFNNTGVDGQGAPLHRFSEENWDRVLSVNLKSVWLCMKYEIEHMLRVGRGSIVNMAAVAGLVGFEQGISAYVAAKHGVVGLTRAAALEYAQQGIRVNAVCPGLVRTPMISNAIRQGLVAEGDLAGMHPMNRTAEPEEIAEAVAWLCSDAASFVTGQPLAIDGGMTAR